jgi:peptidyl-prolyl cis-trans isomerase SDCCAG10
MAKILYLAKYDFHQGYLLYQIVGDTVFNLLKIGESDVDDDEKPLYPTTITSVDILHNPFDDIVPRTTPQEKKARAEAERLKREKEQQAKRPKGKK